MNPPKTRQLPGRCTMVLAATIATSLISLEALSAPVTTIDAFFDPNGLEVAPEDYPTAETSRQLLIAQSRAPVNALNHARQLTPTNDQPVVRMNRDSYYSFAVVDVSAGATITIPPIPEGTYASVQPVTEDHRIQPMSYGSGTFQLATHKGSHIYVIVRLDSTLSQADANRIQDGISISAGSAEAFSAEPVNEASFMATEASIRAKAPQMLAEEGGNAVFGMFTAPTDPSRGSYTVYKHQMGAALGWGGAQSIDNLYELSPQYPAEGCHQATFEDPRNGAFWSFTVYDEAGFMFDDLASVSSDTATPNEDGTFTVSFGCGSDAINSIPTMNASGVFNLAVRHYRPSERVREEGYRLVPYVKKVSE